MRKSVVLASHQQTARKQRGIVSRSGDGNFRCGATPIGFLGFERDPKKTRLHHHGRTEENPMFKKTLIGATAIALALASANAALADTKDKKIALSNNYAGNSWRQAMLKSWDKVTKKAVADGVVAAAD